MTMEINARSAKLTSAETRIVDYIMCNPSRFILLAINQVADELEISEATISRFVRHCGFKDYKELKNYVADKANIGGLASKVANTLNDESFSLSSWYHKQSSIILQSLAMLREEEFSLAVAELSKAKRIYIYGKNASRFLAEEMHYRLRRIKDAIFLLQGSDSEILEGLLRADENSVIVIFAFSKLSYESRMLLEYAKKIKAKTIFITARAFLPDKERPDINLAVYRGEAREYHSLSPANVLIEALVLALSERLGGESFDEQTKLHRFKEEYRKKHGH